jgi:hypothetical protein
MLCRFAQFFIKPLMSQDAVLREIKAVDSGEQLLCSVTLMSARHDDFMLILPPFQNIRCFRFVKQMYLDMF